jgi:hypothetical protein
MFGFGSMGVVLFMLVVFRRDEDHGALVVNQLGVEFVLVHVWSSAHPRIG